MVHLDRLVTYAFLRRLLHRWEETKVIPLPLWLEPVFVLVVLTVLLAVLRRLLPSPFAYFDVTTLHHLDNGLLAAWVLELDVTLDVGGSALSHFFAHNPVLTVSLRNVFDRLEAVLRVVVHGETKVPEFAHK